MNKWTIDIVQFIVDLFEVFVMVLGWYHYLTALEVVNGPVFKRAPNIRFEHRIFLLVHLGVFHRHPVESVSLMIQPRIASADLLQFLIRIFLHLLRVIVLYVGLLVLS